MLEEAAHLALEYIGAVLGRGHEMFGLDDFLHCGSTPTWLPYTALDQLAAALKEAGETQGVYQKVQL